MQTFSKADALRAEVAAWKRVHERVAFVPTMGNLHAGHIALVRHASTLAQRVVVSIFVNPLQFGPSEDFERYPRTLEQDLERLGPEAVDAVFLPDTSLIYPRPLEQMTRVEVPGLSGILCGESRPGHFAGVATVVCKLFNLAQPDVAVFGEKDWQQLAVIRRMTQDLNLPVAITSHATVREPDGLAMSSRNGYLNADERRRAPRLYRTLQHTAGLLQAGRQDYTALEADATVALDAVGFKADYVSIRRADDLGAPEPGARLIVLGAAWLGKTRLIDNMAL
jgi:pantoate--beta-alanine ligase